MAQRLSQPGRDAAAELSQLLCRVRPCEKPSPLVVLHDDEAKLEVALETNSSQSQGADRTTNLNFDKIFHEDQQELFVQLQPAIISCIGGASCTVVAHGGQQSGKSYALSGLFTSGETHGLAPRAVQAITEEIERMTGPVPSVEASFFELQQDAVCDLLSASAPRVAMRETTQPPFVALDPHLTAMKCDGASGFNRLLDAYFTGLEHRRKGNHTCFQVTFTRANKKRSYLRLIEMVWPRQQAGKPPGAGKAATALEQILQSKLNGTSCGYRGAPLALLLKPCLEGASSLCFIHCLRLEPAHLANLAIAAPLLAKLYQWMCHERKLRKSKQVEGSPVPKVKGSKESRGPYVPPLHLDAHLGSTGGSCTLSADPLDSVDGVTATSGADPTSASGASSESVTSGRSGKPPPMVGATSEDTVPGGEGGTGEASMGVKPLFSDASESTEDLQVNELLSRLLQVKRRTVEALEQDARHSSGAFQELDSLLGRIMSSREAQGNGPDERETNLKLVYEQVYRSIQRSTEQVSKIRHEVQELESFCRKGYIPPVYDAYAASQQDIQKMKEMQHEVVTEEKDIQNNKAKMNLTPPWPPAPQVIEIPQLPLSCLQGDPEPQRLPEGIATESSSGSSSSPGGRSPSVSGVGPLPLPGVATAPVQPGPGWAQVVHSPAIHGAPTQPGTMVHKAPPMSITPPVPMAFPRAPGAGSPMLPYRPVSPQVAAHSVSSLKVAGPKGVPTLNTSESVPSMLGQAAPPRFHTNGRCTVQGGSMSVGPGAGMMCQIGSPLQAFRTTTPSKPQHPQHSPVLMTRTLQAQAPQGAQLPQGMGTMGTMATMAPTRQVMGSPPAETRAVAPGASPALQLRGCRSASELPMRPVMWPQGAPKVTPGVPHHR